MHSPYLQSCCLVSDTMVKEMAIYKLHLFSSLFLQRHKQLLPRSLIIHNLILPAWLATILQIWCFSWIPTPSLYTSLTACRERNTFSFFSLFPFFFFFEFLWSFLNLHVAPLMKAYFKMQRKQNQLILHNYHLLHICKIQIFVWFVCSLIQWIH